MDRGRQLARVERRASLATEPVDNRQIADRLDAFATLLELAEANPYTARAYRRAAETIRAAPVPVAELVRAGRVRELRGIGPGIDARLRELVETGEIAELSRARARARARARRPRPLPRARAPSARSRSRRRSACGRPTSSARRPPRGGCRACPASGRRPRRACARRSPARPSRARSAACCSTAPGSSSAASRPRWTASSAGDARRWRDSCERLAVVCAAADPGSALARFAALPQIVAVIEQAERRAVG